MEQVIGPEQAPTPTLLGLAARVVLHEALAAAVEAMKMAFAQLATGEAVLSLRTVVATPNGDGSLLLMPAFLSRGQQVGVKLLSLFPGNPGRGLPLIHALMTVFDGETGRPLARRSWPRNAVAGPPGRSDAHSTATTWPAKASGNDSLAGLSPRGRQDVPGRAQKGGFGRIPEPNAAAQRGVCLEA